MLLSLCLTGCASLLGGVLQEDEGYSVTATKINWLGTNPGVSYKSLAYYNAKEKELAERVLGTYTPQMGKEGLITVRVGAPTLEAAKAQSWTFVVLDAQGCEIIREKGTGGISDYTTPDTGSSSWYSYHILTIPEGSRFPLTLRVVSEVDSGYSEYIISKKG